MPWKECSFMDERLRFVSRLLDGEAMTEVCREFGISRKTGYKIFGRYKATGLEALTDRSRRSLSLRGVGRSRGAQEPLRSTLHKRLLSAADGLAGGAAVGHKTHPPLGIHLAQQTLRMGDAGARARRRRGRAGKPVQTLVRRGARPV